MGAVFTSAARAPLTSLASVVELTGDFTLTLPVMLAVAIASAVSRMLSYGTIYTTKLLRRGIDVDQAAPWRAFGDLKVREAMQQLGTPLAVPDGNASAANGKRPGPASLPGPVTREYDPQILFSNESVAQALRQLEVYGNDGLPVLSPGGQQIQGWVTNASVLRVHRPPDRRIREASTRGPAHRRMGSQLTRSRPSASHPPRCPATRSWKSPSPRLPCRRAAARRHHMALRMDPRLRRAQPAAGHPRPGSGSQPRGPHQPSRAQSTAGLARSRTVSHARSSAARQEPRRPRTAEGWPGSLPQALAKSAAAPRTQVAQDGFPASRDLPDVIVVSDRLTYPHRSTPRTSMRYLLLQENRALERHLLAQLRHQLAQAPPVPGSPGTGSRWPAPGPSPGPPEPRTRRPAGHWPAAATG